MRKRTEQLPTTTGIDISKLGFKQAFKATLGFHLANTVAGLIQFAIVVSILAAGAGIIYFFATHA